MASHNHWDYPLVSHRLSCLSSSYNEAVFIVYSRFLVKDVSFGPGAPSFASAPCLSRAFEARRPCHLHRNTLFFFSAPLRRRVFNSSLLDLMEQVIQAGK